MLRELVRLKPVKRKYVIWRDNRGAAAIEMALVLPILVVLVLGIMEFGILMFSQKDWHISAVKIEIENHDGFSQILQTDPQIDSKGGHSRPSFATQYGYDTAFRFLGRSGH